MRGKYQFFSIFVITIIFISIVIFPSYSENPLTFAQMKQDKNETLKKYKNEWNNYTIKHISSNIPIYEKGDIVATITIPKMEIFELPVYYGADPVNNNWKITTAGHLGNYAMFGESGVSCIGAHNYQLFKNLTTLKIGDKLIVETSIDRYVYIIDGIDIYRHGKDIWSQKATKHKNDYALTLMTCFPINAIETSDMYLVYASLQKGTIYDSF